MKRNIRYSICNKSNVFDLNTKNNECLIIMKKGCPMKDKATKTIASHIRVYRYHSANILHGILLENLPFICCTSLIHSKIVLLFL